MMPGHFSMYLREDTRRLDTSLCISVSVCLFVFLCKIRIVCIQELQNWQRMELLRRSFLKTIKWIFISFPKFTAFSLLILIFIFCSNPLSPVLLSILLAYLLNPRETHWSSAPNRQHKATFLDILTLFP